MNKWIERTVLLASLLAVVYAVPKLNLGAQTATTINGIPNQSTNISGGGNTTSTSLTSNTIPMANGANSIVNSLFTNDGKYNTFAICLTTGANCQATFNTSSATPAAGSDLGTGGTVACVTTCNALRGRLLITPGTPTPLSGNMATVTFGTAYANTNYVCIVTQNGSSDGTIIQAGWLPTSASVMTITASGGGFGAFAQEVDYSCTP